MSCKNKDGNNKNKSKKIVCKSCKCSYDEDDKVKVVCKDCEDQDDTTIICEYCECIDNDENDDKQICLKNCSKDGVNEDTIYIR